MIWQYITRYIRPLIANTFSCLSHLITILLLTAFLAPSGFAKSELTYGPIQKGQTLWNIAEETRPNNAITIEQVVYAFYDLNPNAFHSGNMNLLKTGSYITIPDTDTIQKTNNKTAKNKLNQHVHALALLRVDAKQLKRSKQQSRKYINKIKRTQKHLANYRYESKAWNNTYRKLVKIKRLYAKSRRKTERLRKLLLEKATIATKPPISIKSTNIMSDVKVQLTQIQSSIMLLQQSNEALNNKANALELMNQRIIVLENELGKTDKLVIQLKNAIENLQDDIKAQKENTKTLEQNIEEVKSSESTKKDAPPLLPSYDTNNIRNNNAIDTEALRIELTPAEQTVFEYLAPSQHLQAPQEEDLLSHTFEEFHPSEIRHASFSQITPVSASHQHQVKKQQQGKTPLTYSNLISIGGILNGIILIFVLSLLLFHRQTD